MCFFQGKLKEGLDEYEWRLKPKKVWQVVDISHNLYGWQQSLKNKKYFSGVSKVLGYN